MVYIADFEEKLKPTVKKQSWDHNLNNFYIYVVSLV